MSAHPPPAAHTLVDMLRQQAERYRDKVAFRFCPDGGDETEQLTYAELDTRARAIAANLQQHGAAGQRVLLVCRPGLDNVAGFFGCLYAGAIAVPVHQRLPRVTLVAPDARAGFVLAAPETRKKIKAVVDTVDTVDTAGIAGDGRSVRWCVPGVPAEDATDWVPPDIGADTTAVIQYTSGSTRAPKGVVLTHRNLMHNVAAIRPAWDGDDRAVGVYWLPQHHDMGLIGGILEMLYVGCTTVLMSPNAFITRPIRWLEAISRHRGTTTAAPNFAYDKCVESSTPAERAALDLSFLTTAMSGAEPVHAATLRRFTEAFAPAGFRPEALRPVYGLAEASLLVSGGSDSPVPVVRHIKRTALGMDRVVDAKPKSPTAVAVVGCGRPQGGQRVVIVDPESRLPRGADEVGEIWVAGPSVARGYWARPEETEHSFSAVLARAGADGFTGPFLRTGDLGFLRSGELFITGRVKDLITIGDSNYYPNDIEITVQDGHPAFLSGRGAVFSVIPSQGADGQLIVVQEVDRALFGEAGAGGVDDVIAAVRATVATHHGIELQSVVLVEPMRIPTTSSGKIRRSSCRQLFLDGGLEPVAEWHAPPAPGDHTGAAPPQDAAAAVAEVIKAARAKQFWGSRQS